MRQATWQEYVARFWSYVDQSGGPDACWPWTKSTRGGNQREHRKKGTKGVYGQFWCQGKPWYAHRFAYASKKGPIPPGADIDHECENTLCCNPAHLRAVTPALNAHYSMGVPRPGDDDYVDWVEDW
jgi:hypothetical protein